ncbi:MAG TPA: class I SAM-dependent methyltransferase [Prolixibacteraceae bacterium]|nr:class I SAM-dependent methyltransferase [Prolixibacteraceae bacterium]
MLAALGRQLRKPSGFFGKIVSRMMNARNRKFYQRIISDLDIQSGDRIYEIGYGPGLGIEMIAQSRNDCTISGIDFSELMVRSATKRNKRFIDAGRVDLKYGDLLTADTAKERYDKIFCVNVIYFWNDLKSVFSKIYSMLGERGAFCIFMTAAEDMETGFAVDFKKYSMDEVEKALKEAGFKGVEYALDHGYFIKAQK